MCRLNHERSQIWVTVFADSHLWIRFAGLPLFGLQSEVAANLPAVCETLPIIKRNDKGERGKRSYAAHLFKHLGFRVLFSCHSVDFSLMVQDRVVQRAICSSIRPTAGRSRGGISSGTRL